MADLMPEKPSGNGSGKLDIIATYDYTDEHGKLLYQVCRLSPKSFRQRRPEGEGWSWKLGDVTRVLYRLQAVLDQADRGGVVYVVEGEKDVAAVEQAGGVATCNSGGAGKWRDEYSAALKGAQVIVVADNDEPGRKHAAQVAASLKGVAASVSIVKASVGKDVADHLGADKTLAELVGSGPRIYTAREFSALTPEVPDYVVWGYVARGAMTEVAAKIKTGKTRFALDLCWHVVTGTEFLGHYVERCPVLYLTEERAPSFRAAIGRVGLANSDDFHILTRNEVRQLSWPEVGEFVAQFCRDRGVGVVCGDTLSDWAGLAQDAEKDAGAALQAMVPLQKIASDGVAVIVCRHEGHADRAVGESARGSTAFGGAMDILVSLRRCKGAGHDNRRDLLAVGRFDETPAEAVIETHDDGHYVQIGTSGAVQTNNTREALLALLPQLPSEAFDPNEIRAVLPVDLSWSMAEKLLQRLVSDGIVRREKGVGLASAHAFGYWISGSDHDEVM
jgi:5S rRNA maturation endonuclease (ribonuclease M5)